MSEVETGLFLDDPPRVSNQTVHCQHRSLRAGHTVEWSTPQELFDELAKTFKFAVDVCASAETAKCEKFFVERDDAISRPWDNVSWCNPPYGRRIGDFVAKSASEAKLGNTVVCLLPVRADTRWWHDYVMPAGTVLYLRGRLRFGDVKAAAPFASVVVIFFGGRLGGGRPGELS